MGVEIDVLKLSDPNLSENQIVVRNSGLIVVQLVEDVDGPMTVEQYGIDLPEKYFKRHYARHFINPGAKCGHHAHKVTDQIIFATTGQFTLHLDDGESRQDILMDEIHIGVRLGRELWHAMTDFAPNSGYQVWADTFYDKADYIIDYQEFLEYIRPH